MVIVVLAPVVVRLVSRIPASRLLATGFAILGLAMWYFASFNLATDYAREAGARGLQGLGLAFLFVPASQLAYSYLPKDKNNKASSLTNLFRNQGGSFGIALVTTLLARRTQYHQSVLVTHVTTFDQSLNATVTGITNRFIEQGSSTADASVRALAQVYATVQQQAAMLAFLDCFRILGLVALIGVPLAIFIRKFKQGASAAAH
jgi:DHA2 family multidrug resistance protein